MSLGRLCYVYARLTFFLAIDAGFEKDNVAESERESESVVHAGLVASTIVFDSSSAQDPDASERGVSYVQSGQNGGKSSSAVPVMSGTSNHDSQHSSQTQTGKSPLKISAVRIISQRNLRLPNIAPERKWPSLSNSPGFLSPFAPTTRIKVEGGVQEESEEEVVELGENMADIISDTGMQGDPACLGATTDAAKSVTRQGAFAEMLSAKHIAVGEDSDTDNKMECDSEEDRSSGMGGGEVVGPVTQSTSATIPPMQDHGRKPSRQTTS